MTNMLGKTLNVKEHQSVRLTVLGWCILFGVVWTLVGVTALFIYMIPELFRAFLLVGFVDQVSIVFIGPGLSVLFVLLLVWIATIGDLYEVYDEKDDDSGPRDDAA